MKTLKYISYITRHKFFVFQAGLKTKAPLWRLIIHDWSKFDPKEWRPYREFFYGERNHDTFRPAWNLHLKRNKHHWQYWVLISDSGDVSQLEMPEKFVREMVADWMGAGRAITGKWEAKEWYEGKKAGIRLHPSTRLLVESLLNV